MFDFTKAVLCIVLAFVIYDHINKYLTVPAWLTSVIASVTHAAREVVSVPSRIARAFTGIFTGFASGWKSVVVAPVSAPAATKLASGLPAFNKTNPLGTVTVAEVAAAKPANVLPDGVPAVLAVHATLATTHNS
jgi:hypothetical protein